MKLYLIRHGESEANVARVISGQTEARLTAQGQWQAEVLGLRLADLHFNYIFSSDLLRARQTTELATSRHNSNMVCFDAALRERNWGIYENQPVELFIQAAEKAGCEPWEFEPEGGESLGDLLLRLKTFSREIIKLSQSGQQCLISAHHAINKVLIMLLLNRDWQFWKTLHQDNACVNILTRQGEHFELELLNCTRHLAINPNKAQ